MKLLFVLGALATVSLSSPGQNDGDTLRLASVVAEAIERNPEIHAAHEQISVIRERGRQSYALEDPQVYYMREEMPGFTWNEAMMERVGVMQAIRFPTKLTRSAELAEIQTEHANHEHREKMNEITERVKSAFIELWMTQEMVRIDEEQLILSRQLVDVAYARYSSGQVAQTDLLMAEIERARVENGLTSLRAQERGARAMLQSILNRPAIVQGTAVLPESDTLQHDPSTLQGLALKTRPLLLHDSLSIEEEMTMSSLAGTEYIPDISLGVEYKWYLEDNAASHIVPGQEGWGINIGVSIPFIPWSLAKADARVEEAEAGVRRAQSTFLGSRAMVLAQVEELYTRAASFSGQLRTYQLRIIPAARQSYSAALSAYQTGRASYQALGEAYRMLLMVRKDHVMTRGGFERAVASLERTTGLTDIRSKGAFQ